MSKRTRKVEKLDPGLIKNAPPEPSGEPTVEKTVEEELGHFNNPEEPPVDLQTEVERLEPEIVVEDMPEEPPSTIDSVMSGVGLDPPHIEHGTELEIVMRIRVVNPRSGARKGGAGVKHDNVLQNEFWERTIGHQDLRKFSDPEIEVCEGWPVLMRTAPDVPPPVQFTPAAVEEPDANQS